MAGGQERLLRRRIRSVESTKKITRAMELIAASQMMRAQSRIAGSRPYLSGIRQVLADVAGDGTVPERLMGVPESPSRVAVVAVVSDRGLCGGYNTFVLRTADRLMRTGSQAGREFRLTTVGKKAIGYFHFRGRPVDHSFSMPDRPQYELARNVAATVVPAFVAGEVDLVQLVSTRFVSAGVQHIETRQILPIVPPGDQPDRGGRVQVSPRPGDGEAGRGSAAATGSAGSAAATGSAASAAATTSTGSATSAGSATSTGSAASTGSAVSPGSATPAATAGSAGGDEQTQSQGLFEFEPNPEELLALLLPRYAEAAIYQALLEASASEHVARQRAMSAATENADDLIKNLRRIMNRARQETITTEIMEIVGGAEALRQGSANRAAPGRDLDLEEQIG